MNRSIIAMCMVLVAVGCEKEAALEQAPPQLNAVTVENSTFQPAEAPPANRPAWVLNLRSTLEEIRSEGVALGLADRPAGARTAWLVYDPELSPPNWIISAGGSLPANVDALRIRLALLRVQRPGPIVVGFKKSGNLVDETTREVISRSRFIDRRGPDVHVAVPDLGPPGQLKLADLPHVGRVRYRTIQ